MYLCVFVMAVCPIVDVLRYSRSEHKPLNYFLSTLLQRNLRFMQYPFFLPRAVFPASPWPLLTILFSFYKIPFYPVVKKEFFIPKQKKIVKKGEKFYSIIWMALVGVIWYYDFRSRLNQTKSGSFNCKHQSYYVEYIKYVLLQTLLKMRRIDTRIKCFIL